ncbi:hypothetical protein C8R43DRAFT_942407 [Mycena crocata]|nr:hypothetical protein C8R43DRAFT_942407 [Mycena crocata]
MDRLVALSLELFGGSAQTEAFLASLNRYGITRTRGLFGTGLLNGPRGVLHSSWLSLPVLRGVVSHRELEELVISQRLDHNGLRDLCSLVDRGVCGRSIVTLIIRVEDDVDTTMIFEVLAGVLPRLEQLSLDKAGMDPKHSLPLLVDSRRLFPNIRRFALNTSLSWRLVPEGVSDPIVSEICVWMDLNVPTESRLDAFSIGGVVWYVDAVICTWVAKDMVGTVLVTRYIVPGM